MFMVFQAGTRNLSRGLRVGKITADRSVSDRQRSFLRRLEPVERWPSLAVPRFGIFRGARHRFESVTTVNALCTLSGDSPFYL